MSWDAARLGGVLMPRLTLLQLASGDRFKTASGRVGTLLYVNECRARVKFDGDARHVELADGTAFDAPGRPLDIAARTEVTRVEDDV